MQRLYDLPDMAFIDMGDFAGGTLKYLRHHPLPRLTIAGGFGKLSKLAAGHLDLHSSRSSVDTGQLADLLAELNAPGELVARARGARSAGEVLEMTSGTALNLPDLVAQRARSTALAALAGGTALDVVIFDRQGQKIGQAGP